MSKHQTPSYVAAEAPSAPEPPNGPEPTYGAMPAAPAPVAAPPHRSLSTPPPPARVLPNQPWVEVAPEEYPGYSVRLWINHPAWLYEQAMAGGVSEDDEARRRDAWGQIVLEHNGWPDPIAEGGTLPQPSDHDFWRRGDERLLFLTMARLRAEKSALPPSIRNRR